MNIHSLYATLATVICLTGINAFSAIPARADEVCRSCPFDCQGIGARRDDCSELRSRGGQCCVNLDNRGLDQLRDRDSETSRGSYNRDSNDHRRYSDERDDRNHESGYNRSNYARNESNNRRNDPNSYDDKNGFQPGDCPAGFHVNDRACTDSERRRGCQDVRSPSGRTCTGWGNNPH